MDQSGLESALEQVDRRIRELTPKHKSLRSQLVHVLQSHLPPECSNETLEPFAVVESRLKEVQRALQLSKVLSEILSTTKHIEKLVRTAERQFQNNAIDDSLRPLSGAVERYKEAGSIVEKVKEDGCPVPACCQKVVDRLYNSGQALKTLLEGVSQTLLSQNGWPPPLSGSHTWPGFDSSTVSLQTVFFLMINLQQEMEHDTFKRIADAEDECQPILWPSHQLAVAPVDWLHTHFAGGLPTDRADKPAWLFKAVLNACRRCGPAVETLQSCVDAAGLETSYSLHYDVCRAVAAGTVNRIIRGHVLPRLACRNESTLWLHYMDEAVRFETELCVIQGKTWFGNSGDWPRHPRSALEVVFDKSEWSESWMGAEKADAQERLRMALQWKPTLSAEGDDEEKEFRPLPYSEAILSVIADLYERSLVFYHRTHRKSFVSCVIDDIFKLLRVYIEDDLQRMEQFDRLLEDSGLAMAGGHLCTVHYLEHMFAEPQGILLTMTAEDDILATVSDRAANSLAGLWKRWATKLGRVASGGLVEYFEAYSEQLESSSCIESVDAPLSSMVIATDAVRSLLRRLQSVLDSVVFRSCWKEIAYQMNQVLLNDVIAVGTFSAPRAQQLALDIQFLVHSVFGEYTRKPESYFKQTEEACRLLTIERKDALEIANNDGDSILGRSQAKAVIKCRGDVRIFGI